MEITYKQAHKIIEYLDSCGFKILSFGESFEKPFEVIDEEYFREKVNEVLEEFK